MIYRLGKSYPDSLIVLPGELREKANMASETELKVLLLSCHALTGGAEEEELISLLEEDFTREEILSALAFWRGCGILVEQKKRGRGEQKPKKAPAAEVLDPAEPPKKQLDADEAPFYTAKDLADAAEAQPEFKNLVDFAEQRLEKVMNVSELARLYSFLDYLKMPLDVVLLVIEHSASQGKKSLRYITKILTNFQDEGIDTYEKAEQHFLYQEEQVSYERIVRKLFGLGDRKLSRQEEECVTAWRVKFAYEEDMLTAAYEKTVAAAKNPSIKYMHRILENWFTEGYRTPEEAEAGGSSSKKAQKSYDLDDFFMTAVEKGKSNTKKEG